MNNPRTGELRFFHETLDLPADGLRLVAHLPADDATARACATLQEAGEAAGAPSSRLRVVNRSDPLDGRL